MAFARGVGFDLCPCLKALKDRHLFLLRGSEIPAILSAVCHAHLDPAKIEAQWDPMVHLFASAHSGHTSAINRGESANALKRPAAGADRAHRAYTHRGDQSARGLQFPHRAVRRAAALVTLGSEISTCGSLVGGQERAAQCAVRNEQNTQPDQSLANDRRKIPKKTASSYRHFWHRNQGNPCYGRPAIARAVGAEAMPSLR